MLDGTEIKCEHEWTHMGYDLRPGTADCDVNALAAPGGIICIKCRRVLTLEEFEIALAAAERGETISV